MVSTPGNLDPLPGQPDTLDQTIRRADPSQALERATAAHGKLDTPDRKIRDAASPQALERATAAHGKLDIPGQKIRRADPSQALERATAAHGKLDTPGQKIRRADPSQALDRATAAHGKLDTPDRKIRDAASPQALEQAMAGLQQLKRAAGDQIRDAASPQALEQLRISFLGKKGGQLSRVLGAMGALPHAQRPLVGQQANALKKELQELLKERLQELEAAALTERLRQEAVDVTAPALYRPLGHPHPLLSTLDEIITIFCGLGYQVVDGPEIETDHYNFSALNIPEDHPAREMQDTFYLPNGELLRTHTSPVQIRHLERHKPPVRVIAPGRVYRRDAVDATHSPIFHQVEVLAVDEGLNFGHLRGTVIQFLQAFFGALPVRFRASYFPFTEPSAEVDVQWQGRWLEVMGCGMVDPAVLEGLGLDPERWSGFAAGMGVERACMVRHGIDDIRRLFSSDLRFLRQF